MRKVFISVGMSLDGYMAGPNSGPKNPLGDGGVDIHQWAFATKAFLERHGTGGGESASRDNEIVQHTFQRAGAQILTLSEGVVEQSDGDSLDVLLPPAVAKKLGVPEEARLRVTTPADIPDVPSPGVAIPGVSGPHGPGRAAHVLTYSAETLEKLSSLIGVRGTLQERYARRLYLKHEGIGSAVTGYFSPLNGLGNVKSSRMQTVSYLICNAQYTALSDERKEGVVETALNEFTGRPVEDVCAMLRQAETAQASLPTVERKPADFIYRSLLSAAQRSIERELLQFQQSLHRKLLRDFRRVEEYYGSLVREIEDKIQRRALQGNERATEMQRIEGVHLELRKKLVDQRERYAVRVAVRWLNAMRVYFDVIVVVYEVRRKQRARDLELIWNPLKKDFEDLGCDRCGNDLRAFWMCEEVPHILCESCSVCPGCGRNVCRTCHPQKCARCQSPY